MLDYDGTLAPFSKERDKAFPYLGVRPIIKKILSQGKTHLAIVSGRKIEEIAKLLNVSPLPEIWGEHGTEHLSTDGKHRFINKEEKTISAINLIYEQLLAHGLERFCEKKTTALALHWRGLNLDKKMQLQTIGLEIFNRYSMQENLSIHTFDGGIELRPSNYNKGNAVREILKKNINIPSAYLGDDLTDEDAFKALKKRGLSILVKEKHRQTFADIRISPPKELIDFLEQWYKISLKEI